MPDWLSNATFYEIYPQSFNDTNGDGIGDIPGITEKLDYVRSLGFNAIWLNPCFVSPFADAGYDVADYRKVAPRYGTNEDLYTLFREAHKRDMHIILDLVPGHTSEAHPWFLESKRYEKNAYTNRYIWTNCVWNKPPQYAWVAGTTDRDACYMLNFFNSQPALNYGFNQITDPAWQIPYTDERVKPTFDEILDIMRFWLDRGCDGFRVDMADSLVKNDPDKVATSYLWSTARQMLDKHYPNAVLVSEWCDAPKAINNAGFHCDFLLEHHNKMGHYAFRNRTESGKNYSYFCKTAHVSAHQMLDLYTKELAATQGRGYMSPISGNHDTERISKSLDTSELRLAYTFLLTLPGVPFFYYGDEIGLCYIPQKTKEGGYNRTGSRTPMQWDATQPNFGFSSAEKKSLYLMQDRRSDAPAAAQQILNNNSLWHLVRKLNEIRHKNEDLQADAPFEVLVCGADGLLCYKRGKTMAVAFNPTNEPKTLPMPIGIKVFEVGSATPNGSNTDLAPQTAVIFHLSQADSAKNN